MAGVRLVAVASAAACLACFSSWRAAGSLDLLLAGIAEWLLVWQVLGWLSSWRAAGSLDLLLAGLAAGSLDLLLAGMAEWLPACRCQAGSALVFLGEQAQISPLVFWGVQAANPRG